ncbi:MAG TPA: Clp protease N-terminal domain-containing protein [Propionibacteriaceae bacterium]|nr:Clp protease N-terminal domain-containing protein [Propionibacteriaceae bacterium]
MFERFSGQARQVVVLAQEEARDLDHNYIGTEHVLLALLATSDSLAGASLKGLGYTHDDVRAKVEVMVGRGKTAPSGHIPFTPRAKKVLELSLREALHLKHNYIGTEHILLGMLREGEGRGAQILADKHPLDRIRGELLARIESPAGRESHGEGRTPAAHEVLALAAELAGDTPVGSHHILEAILQQPDSAAAKALIDAGIDLDQLAAKLDEISTEDTADDTPEEAAARQLEFSVSDDAVTVVLRDRGSVELGKQIVNFSGVPPTAQGAQVDLHVQLWTVINSWLASTARALAPSSKETEELFSRGVRSRFRRRKAS